jgi:site-specific DNA recombinase
MRGIQYIRVSDEEQAIEGFSIQAQKAMLDRKFKEWEATCEGVYIDDGYSAKNLNRPDLQRLIQELPQTKPDFIAFWKLDRWTRQGKDWHQLKDMTKGIKLRSAIGENTNEETAFNRFNVGLNVLLGQFEREQISERVHFVMMERHLKGLRNGAKAPYGYELKDGKLVVVESQAEVIRKIFDMYQSLEGFRGIATKINQEYPDRLWSYSTVRYALMNPIYTGKLRWNHRSGGKIDGKEILADADHEPIISVETFEKVNQEISSRSKGGKTVVSDHIFSGVLKCARCGSAMVGFTANKSKYYRCVRRVNYNDCKQPIVKLTRLEEMFLESIQYDSEQMRKYLNVTTDDGQRKDKLISELEALRKRKKKWQIAYADDAISLQDYKDRVAEDAKREVEIETELKAAKPSIDKKEILDTLNQIQKLWVNAPDREKKMFVRELFKSITVMAVSQGRGSPGKQAILTITDLELT